MTAPDPEFRAVVEEFDSYHADWVSGDPVALREVYARHRALLASDAAPCDITPFSGAARGLRFATPESGSDHAIVYFHGGSWTVGSPATHRVPCSHLAVMSGLPVWSCAYGLGPEHPWPAQREDGAAAAQYVLESGAERIFLAGDSAGAAVAFWADAALPDALRRRIVGILGFYGGYGLSLDERASGEVGQDDGLSAEALLAALQRLGPLDDLRGDPSFDIAASAGSSGAPCWIACGDADPLLAGSQRLAERFDEIGRAHRIDIVPGLGHSYLHYVARVDAARRSLERATSWIRARAGR